MEVEVTHVTETKIETVEEMHHEENTGFNPNGPPPPYYPDQAPYPLPQFPDQKINEGDKV